MLQNFISLFIAILMAGFSSGPGLGMAPLENEDESGNIIVRPRNTTPSEIPRMPTAVRIEAYYYDDNSSVCSTLTNAGTTVMVELSNLDTGEYTSCIIPGSGFSVTPISGTSGTWILTYTLSDGSVYEGAFVL